MIPMSVFPSVSVFWLVSLALGAVLGVLAVVVAVVRAEGRTAAKPAAEAEPSRLPVPA